MKHCFCRQQEKRHWRRYIYLWINYALYEELECSDGERTREVYKVCLELIPHKVFTFAKIWLMAAQFEIRQKNLAVARKILVLICKIFTPFSDHSVVCISVQNCNSADA